MENEKRLIDVNPIIERYSGGEAMKSMAECIHDEIFVSVLKNAPTVDAVEVPCKIGDFVWAIRSFKGKKHPQRGIVGDMFFTKDMKLMIVVKYVARGEWGKTVFATDKEAYAAIGERKDNE